MTPGHISDRAAGHAGHGARLHYNPSVCKPSPPPTAASLGRALLCSGMVNTVLLERRVKNNIYTTDSNSNARNPHNLTKRHFIFRHCLPAHIGSSRTSHARSTPSSNTNDLRSSTARVSSSTGVLGGTSGRAEPRIQDMDLDLPRTVRSRMAGQAAPVP